MQRFLWVFGGLTLLLLACVPAINLRTDYSRVLHRDYENTYRTNYENLPFLKYHYLLEHGAQYTSVIFGSSRVRFGFDTADLGSTFGGTWFKMEYPGGSQYQHIEYLRRLVDEGFVPEQVILTIDDFDLWRNGFESKVHADYNRRIAPAGLWSAAEFYWFYLFKNPGEDELAVLEGELELSPTHRVYEDNRGQGIPATEDSVQHHRKIRGLGAGASASENRRYDYSESLGYIRAFVELCQEQGIELRVVFLPIAPLRLLQRNDEDIQSFKRELVQTTPFCDFTGVFPITQNTSHWNELSHFRAPVGALIVRAMAARDEHPGRFGTFVTPQNLEPHLQLIARNIQQTRARNLRKFNFDEQGEGSSPQGRVKKKRG